MSTNETDPWREYVRHMFNHGAPQRPAETPAEETDPATGNVIPLEGDNPSAGMSDDDRMREYVGGLFGRAMTE